MVGTGKVRLILSALAVFVGANIVQAGSLYNSRGFESPTFTSGALTTAAYPTVGQDSWVANGMYANVRIGTRGTNQVLEGMKGTSDLFVGHAVTATTGTELVKTSFTLYTPSTADSNWRAFYARGQQGAGFPAPTNTWELWLQYDGSAKGYYVQVRDNGTYFKINPSNLFAPSSTIAITVWHNLATNKYDVTATVGAATYTYTNATALGTAGAPMTHATFVFSSGWTTYSLALDDVKVETQYIPGVVYDSQGFGNPPFTAGALTSAAYPILGQDEWVASTMFANVRIGTWGANQVLEGNKGTIDTFAAHAVATTGLELVKTSFKILTSSYSGGNYKAFYVKGGEMTGFAAAFSWNLWFQYHGGDKGYYVYAQNAKINSVKFTPGSTISTTLIYNLATRNYDVAVSDGINSYALNNVNVPGTLKTAMTWVNFIFSTNTLYEMAVDDLKVEIVPAGTAVNVVSGTITLNDYNGTPSTVPATIQILDPSTGTVIETQNATGGAYSFTTGLSGTYNLRATASHWLGSQISGVALGTNPVNFTLTNGDIDQDNMIGDNDLSIMLSKMDLVNAQADLDGDGEVTSSDLSILLANVNQPDAQYVVYADLFGYNSTDATGALISSICNSGASKVIVRNMGSPWITNQKINLWERSNLTVEFEPGVVVQAKEDCFHGTNDYLFQISYCDNLKFTGYGAKFQMRKSDYLNPANYTPSEWRHAMTIYGGNNITIEGLTLCDSGGDGIYISSYFDDSRNITLKDVVCDNNYRQGMSVIKVNGLMVDNCIFRNTSGTAPEHGIDFEPNSSSDLIQNVVVQNSILADNAGDGIAFAGTNTGDITATIENCTFYNNTGSGIGLYAGSIPGLTIQDCLLVNNQQYGVVQTSGTSSANVQYSAFWSNISGAIFGNVTLGTGSIANIEPLFVSTDPTSTDYLHLAPGCSTAITQGTSDGSYMGARSGNP